MKKIIIFLVLLIFAFSTFGMQNSEDLMSLLSIKKKGVFELAYPASILDLHKYNLYLQMMQYNNIIDEVNYDYNEGFLFNYQKNKVKLATAIDMAQFKMGNFVANEYSLGIANELNGNLHLRTGLGMNVKMYGFSSEYSDPLINDKFSFLYDFSFNSSIEIIKNLYMGLSVLNILDSDKVSSGFFNSVHIISGAGYSLKNYGILAVGFSRDAGYNTMLLSYGIQYHILFFQLNYDFHSISGGLVLQQNVSNNLGINIFGDLHYLQELGFVYKLGLSMQMF